MLYAFEQQVPIHEDLYTKIMKRIGPQPLEGLIVHLAIKADDGTLRYIDVWASKEAYDRAVQERIHPAVSATFSEVGYRPDVEPTLHPIDVVDVMGSIGARQD